jgi:hypothetical protein
LPVAAFGLMMACAANARAGVYDYVIAPTVIQYAGPSDETISGEFSFSGSTLLSVDLTLSGAGPGLAGTYTVPLSQSGTLFDAFTATDGGGMAVFFAAPLAGQVDQIIGLNLGLGCSGADCTGGVFQATAVPSDAAADPVAEPMSITVLGAALGLLGLRRRPGGRATSATTMPMARSRPK